VTVECRPCRATIRHEQRNNQTVTAGHGVPVAPAVLVTDASGNPVSGVAVTFAVATAEDGESDPRP